MTIFAAWEMNANYTVTYNANGGRGAPVMGNVFAGETYKIVDGQPTRENYAFSGWSTDSTAKKGDVGIYQPGATISDVQSALTLYAVWELNPSITYNANGGGGTEPTGGTAAYDEAVTVASGDTITKPAGAKRFLGWSTQADAALPNYLANAQVKNLTTTPGATVTLYAVWEWPSYYVTYNADGGEIWVTPEYDVDGNVVADKLKKAPQPAATYADAGTDVEVDFATVPLRKGYTFAGWATTPGASAPEYEEGGIEEITGITGNTTLYAVWTPDAYTVTFDENNAGTTYQQSFEYGTAQKLDPLTSMNFTPGALPEFQGWALTAGGPVMYLDEQTVANLCFQTSFTVDVNDNVTVSTSGPTDLTLYASWASTSAYHLSYDTNIGVWAGAAPAAQVAAADGTLTMSVTNPTRTHHSFNGWAPTPDGPPDSNYYNGAPVTLTENVTLYAQWKPDNYTVTFDANGATGGIMASQTIPMDALTALEPSTYTKDNYTFVGWTTTLPTGDPDQDLLIYLDNQPVYNLAGDASAVTLYAIWEAKDTYALTYNANGGVGGPPSDACVGNATTTLNMASRPTRSGYTFLGWATDPAAVAADYSYVLTGGTEPNGDPSVETRTMIVTADTTLYAVWQAIPAFTVTYTKTGGQGSVPVDMTAYYANDTVNVVFSPTPVRTGHTFGGWSDGNGNTYANGATVSFTMGTTSVTLAPVWTPNEYSVVLNHDGATDASFADIPYGAERTFALPSGWAKTGYSFAGWALTQNGGVAYQANLPYKNLTSANGASIQLYAVWTPVVATLHFDGNKGTGSTDVGGVIADPVPVNYDDPMPTTAAASASLTPPSRPGYTFLGYYDAQTGGNRYYTEDMVCVGKWNKTGGGDVTLYAQWQPMTYELIFMQDGKFLTSKTASFDATAKFEAEGVVLKYPDLVIPTGKKFAGWDTEKAATNTIYAAGQEFEENALLKDADGNLVNIGNRVFYAVIKSNMTYTLKYDANGGANPPMDWNTATDKPAQRDDGDQVLLVVENTPGAKFKVPTRTGYKFLGWSVNAQSDKAEYFPAGTTPDGTATPAVDRFIMPASNVVLYAIWQSDSYAVSYDANGGTGTGLTEEYLYYPAAGSEAKLKGASTFSRQGYVLEGWSKARGSSNSVGYNLEQTLEEPLVTTSKSTTLYAVWSAAEYTVRFDTVGGQTENAISLKYGERYPGLPTPKRDGYAFDGWYLRYDPSNVDAPYSEPISSGAMVAAANDHTLYAKWRQNVCAVHVMGSTMGNITVQNGGAIVSSGATVNHSTALKLSVTTSPGTSSGSYMLMANGRPVLNSNFVITEDTTFYLVSASVEDHYKGAISWTDATYTGKPQQMTAVVTPDVDGDRLTRLTYQWYKNGEEIVGAREKTYALTKVADEGVFTCYISGIGADGLTHSLWTTPLRAQILPAPLTIQAVDHTITYGDAPGHKGVTYVGLVNGETQSVLKGTLTYDWDYARYDAAGDYTIIPKGLTADNYEITFDDGKLTVVPKPVSLAWSGSNFKYDGALKTVTATVSNAVNGDSVQVATYAGNTATEKGTYTASALTLGGVKAGNYTLTGGSNINHSWQISEDGGGTGGGGGGGGGGVEITEVTLTFVVNGGSALDAVTAKKGTIIDLSAYKPTRQGYAFDGWYSDEALTIPVTSLKLEEDSSVYAKWTREAQTYDTSYRQCPQDDTCPISQFTDASPTAWYHDGVHFCLRNGLMLGTSPTEFQPDGTTTRSMIAVILHRLEGSPSGSEGVGFDDVPASMYCAEAIGWAQARGIVTGYGRGRFGPDDPVTREQMAAIFYRYAQYKGFADTERSDLAGFTDRDEVSDWALEALGWNVSSGLIEGTSDGILDPMGQTSRAQVATILMRLCDSVMQKSTTDPQ